MTVIFASDLGPIETTRLGHGSPQNFNPNTLKLFLGESFKKHYHGQTCPAPVLPSPAFPWPLYTRVISCLDVDSFLRTPRNPIHLPPPPLRSCISIKICFVPPPIPLSTLSPGAACIGTYPTMFLVHHFWLVRPALPRSNRSTMKRRSYSRFFCLRTTWAASQFPAPRFGCTTSNSIQHGWRPFQSQY
jgi:hypothetical protein